MRAPACGTAPTEAAAAPMSKGPPPGRWPGWSRTAAPWAPVGGPTAPSPSPWEVTVRPRSRRHRRPGPARRGGGSGGPGVGTERGAAGSLVRLPPALRESRDCSVPQRCGSTCPRLRGVRTPLGGRLPPLGPGAGETAHKSQACWGEPGPALGAGSWPRTGWGRPPGCGDTDCVSPTLTVPEGAPRGGRNGSGSVCVLGPLVFYL